MRVCGCQQTVGERLRATGASVIRMRGGAAGLALCVALVSLAVVAPGEAAADTLVLREPDLTLEGRVVSETRDTVHFALPLFQFIPVDRRRHEDLQWRAEVLRVPRSQIESLTRREHPVPHSRPSGEDSVEERLDAASQYLAAGHDSVLDTARQLYREVLDEFGEAEAAPNEGQLESVRRAAEGMLRFRLLDLLSEWRRADESQREELLAELGRYELGYRVAFELVTVRVLNVTWRLERESRTREQVVEQLQAALVEQREGLRSFVTDAAEAYARAENGFDEQRMREYQEELARRLRTVEALVEYPGAVEALAATRRYGSWVRDLALLVEVVPQAMGEEVGQRLELRIGQDTGVWRARIRAEHVVEVVDGRADRTGAVLREDNEFIREANEALLEGAEESVRETLVAINDYRELLGLRRLEVSPVLMRAAQRSSERFQRRRELSHDLGGTPLQRARREGYSGPRIGENLYRSENRDASAREVLAAWQESPEHHAQMIRQDFRAVGLGQARYYWCLMLGDGR